MKTNKGKEKQETITGKESKYYVEQAGKTMNRLELNKGKESRKLIQVQKSRKPVQVC